MKSLAILSNTTCNVLTQRLGKAFEAWAPDGYDTWIAEALNPSSSIYQRGPEIVLVLLDGRSLLASAVSRSDGDAILHECRAAVGALAEHLPRATVFVSTIDVPHDRIQPLASTRFERAWEYAWWTELQLLAQTYDTVYPFELKDLIERFGRDAFYSRKMWYAGAIPYSAAGYAAIESEFLELVEAFDRPRQKCLALDLDGTLWGGIVGEDGPGGIQLGDSGIGAIYKDFQRRLKEIKETGVLLAVLSKNNPEDVDAVFEKHPHMILKKDDFISLAVNWNDKASNLEDVAKSLNIGADSFVFVDDRQVEQQAMRMMRPEVSVAGFPHEKELLPTWAAFLFRNYFFLPRATREDLQKTAFYRAEKARSELKDGGLSYADYLRELGQYVRFHRFEPVETERVVQLIEKSNQFNLTARRYSRADIGVMAGAAERWLIYTAYSMDRFGDNGLVAVVIVKRNGVDAEIDSFLMSCRVMGRTLEDTILSLLENDLAAAGINELTATYIPTSKNAPVADFYDKNGYLLLQKDPGGVKHYRMALKAGVSRPHNPLVEVVD